MADETEDCCMSHGRAEWSEERQQYECIWCGAWLPEPRDPLENWDGE